jgi:hypothetical protein
MSEILVTIHNAETGEIIQRPANEDELKQMKIDKAEAVAFRKAKAKAEADKAAILERIGLTEAELKTILG